MADDFSLFLSQLKNDLVWFLLSVLFIVELALITFLLRHLGIICIKLLILQIDWLLFVLARLISLQLLDVVFGYLIAD